MTLMLIFMSLIRCNMSLGLQRAAALSLHVATCNLAPRKPQRTYICVVASCVGAPLHQWLCVLARMHINLAGCTLLYVELCV